MLRSARAWWLALAGSLLLHAALLLGPVWIPSQRGIAFEAPPIEARLLPEGARTASRPPAPPPAPPARPQPAPPPVPPAEAVAPESPADAVVAIPPMAASDELPVSAATQAAQPAAETEAAGPSLNALPPRLELRYQVHYGLARGEQTLLWINEGEGYTLTSVASATGLAGVFYRGRFAQTSRGRITPRGLLPEEFWDQRGDKRSSARFDWANDTLTLTPAQGAPRHFALQGEVQDVLSLFFQLALTAPPAEGRLAYTVFNGKKLRNYAYEARGEATLDTALGTLRTLHLVRQAGSDGRFEIWLAIDRHYLPVRVLRSDDKGNEVALALLSVTP